MSIEIESPDGKNTVVDYEPVLRFKRWQFAVLVIMIYSFITLLFGDRWVWANFYLLNGTFLRARSAARLFYAWSIPLTLFNAFFSYRRRDLFTVLILSIAPLSIRQISLMRNHSMTVMFLCFGIVLAAVAAVTVLHLRIAGNRTPARVIENARYVGAVVLCLAFTVGLFVDLTIPGVRAKEIAAPDTAEETTLPQHRVSAEETDLLNSDGWYGLSAEEKAGILRSVAEETANEMGIETPSVFLDTETTNNLAAYYLQSDNSIHLWRSYVEHASPREAVCAVLHELYHAFQHSVIASSAINWDSPDLLTNAYFDQIRRWKEESDSYIDGDRWDVNFSAYYGQALESDARDFAESYVYRFFYDDDIDGY